ncbi:MAG: tripartite tricarboxylate transporter TctB family protein [Rhizobiaceae bacterium]
MESARLQHLIPAGCVLLLAAAVTYISFTQEPADSFLFPRIISMAFILLAGWNFIRAAAGMAKVGGGISKATAMNILPGLVVMIVFVFWAAKGLGFYVASTLAFMTIYSLYDPVPFSSVRDWIKRIIITGAFMCVIYGLFSMLLQVQTPRGLFF